MGFDYSEKGKRGVMKRGAVMFYYVVVVLVGCPSVVRRMDGWMDVGAHLQLLAPWLPTGGQYPVSLFFVFFLGFGSGSSEWRSFVFLRF